MLKEIILINESGNSLFLYSKILSFLDLVFSDSEIPITVVAEKSGFGCQQYLNKIFKKETGFTPAAYRKSCQENYIL